MVNKLVVMDSLPIRSVVSFPPGYDETGEKKWPVLCFLHGSGERAPKEIIAALTTHGPLSPDCDPFAIENFVIIAPQNPRARKVHWNEFVTLVEKSVLEIQKKFKVNPLQTYLTGFSIGGDGIWDYSLRKNQIWAAFWAVDPTILPKKLIKMPYCLALGPYSEKNTDYFIERGFVPFDKNSESEYLYTDLKLDHEMTAQKSYSDILIYKWLLRHEVKRNDLNLIQKTIQKIKDFI